MSLSLEGLYPPPTAVDDTHKVYSIAGWVIAIGVTTTIVVLVRLWQRLVSQGQYFGADDWAMIPALLFYLGWTVMAAYVNLNAGVGKPLWEITLGEYAVWFKGIIASAWLYPVMSASVRLSILLFYQRIFGRTVLGRAVPNFKYVTWTLIIVQVMYVITFSVTPAFICKGHLSKAFDPFTRGLYCDDIYYYDTQVALYSTSMALDIILFFLPLYPVSQLQMSGGKRVSVSILFMLGAGSCIAAAYKLAIFVEQMKRYTHFDPRWMTYQLSRRIPPQFDQYGHTFWIPSQVEPSVALIGASLPAIRPIFGLVLNRFSHLWTAVGLPSFTASASSGRKSTNRTMDSGRGMGPMGGGVVLGGEPKRERTVSDYHELDSLDGHSLSEGRMR